MYTMTRNKQGSGILCWLVSAVRRGDVLPGLVSAVVRCCLVSAVVRCCLVSAVVRCCLVWCLL